MALIKCKECNELISDKSEKCIYCGVKIDKEEKTIPKTQTNKRAILIISVIVIISIFAIMYYKIEELSNKVSNEGNNNTKDVIENETDDTSKEKEENSNQDGSKDDTSKENEVINNDDRSINDKNEFISVINKNLAIILLSSTRCHYCSMYTPILNKVSGEYDLIINTIDVEEIDILDFKGSDDGFDSYLEENNIGTPTLLFFRNGKLVGKEIGYMEEDILISKLKSNSIIE